MISGLGLAREDSKCVIMVYNKEREIWKTFEVDQDITGWIEEAEKLGKDVCLNLTIKPNR